MNVKSYPKYQTYEFINDYKDFITDYDRLYNKIIEHTQKYISEHSLESVVIGISGGLDSALIAALASNLSTKVIGCILPIVSNKEDEIKRAELITTGFCTEYQYQDLSPIYEKFQNYLGLSSNDNANEKINIARGNIKARVRMIKLYDVAGRSNGMVLSTDNFTELLLGFWTLHGDVGDFGMIQRLWKTEVYGLAEYFVDNILLQIKHESKDSSILLKAEALQACIDAIPTDGLGVSDSDFDQILPDYDKNLHPRKNYAIIDTKLIKYLSMIEDDPSIKNEISKDPVAKRFINSAYKRSNPWNIPRLELTT